MKIKTKKLDFDKVVAAKRPEHKNPVRPNIFFRSLIRMLANGDLKDTGFAYTEIGMDKIKDEPCLILMNHSSFIDLEIVSKVFYPKPYCIVCTSDGFVGKEWLMRQIGCIPTNKFVSDVGLINDIDYALHKINTSVLMYPEASYSFDGCVTPLPRHLGLLLKRLDVPVVTIITKGAFARDPLYNCLQKRKVKVSAEVKCLFTKDELKEKSIQELDNILDDIFSFDNFAWQYETRTEITEPFRADGLNRILYKCASCKTEGKMEGKGTTLVCHNCGKEYELDTFGRLHAKNGETEFEHIPDWYRWERKCVKDEIIDGSYELDIPVNIGVLTDLKSIYMVGSGRLKHSSEGFSLTGCDGKLSYNQKPLSSYSLYSDYFWYEIGDVICIGNKDILYYCFPQSGDIVAKTRIATEELYKLKKHRKSSEN